MFARTTKRTAGLVKSIKSSRVASTSAMNFSSSAEKQQESRLTPEVIEIIKATAPVVAPHALTITQTFYPKMFKNNPEVFEFFNKANQVQGRQPEALANAVVAYASNIDNLGALSKAVPLMVEKHCALNVQAEHYGIVYTNLMEAIGEVLGDAVTPEIGNAWSEAVLELADLLIAAEKARYDEVAAQEGGWRGKKNFKVFSVVQESDDIKTLNLTPADGTTAPFFATPGQYVSVADNPTDEKYLAPRHYSISGMDHEANTLRITVKAIKGTDGKPDGIMSNYLHTKEVGEVVKLHAPFGAHQYQPGDHPLTFISAGIGLTPNVPMMKDAIKDGRKTLFAHQDRTPSHIALHEEVEQIAGDNMIVAFNEVDSVDHKNHRLGHLDIDEVLAKSANNAGFYLCGPPAWMQDVAAKLAAKGVDMDKIEHEAFGPAINIAAKM